MERKLAAILSADAKDYSVLIADDDEGTLVTLKACRELMSRIIQAQRGRVVDAPGDNLLAEFASAVDALRAAAQIQRELSELNASLSASRRLLFRIGITVGDVVVDEGRLYGDGVNIAARLEALADPGGICIAGNVREQVVNRVDLVFEAMGEQVIKNIARPIDAWKVSPSKLAPATTTAASTHLVARPAAALPPASAAAGSAFRRRAGIAGALLLIACYAWWSAVPKPVAPAASPPLAPATAATGGLPLPAQPSIVVLPFMNLSGDPAQDYLSDGITDDLTTDLAKLVGLFVISRSTATTYKGTRMPLREIGHELGVRYVLQGSVRRSQARLRINAQLIDTRDESHLWAERYDRPVSDLFAMQDEIRRKIVTALKVKLSPDEQQRFRRASTENLEAYDLYLQGQDAFARARRELNPALMDEARQRFRDAIALDERYAAAYAALALIDWIDWFYDWNRGQDTNMEGIRALAEQALALDEQLPGVRKILNAYYLNARDLTTALELMEHEVALHPNDADAHRSLGGVYALIGRPREAVAAMDRALRLSPRYPAFWAWQMGFAYRYGGRSADALRVLTDATQRAPNYLSNHIVLAAILAEDGQLDAARAEVAAIRHISPSFTAEDVRRRLPFKDPALTEAYVIALRQAGLP